MRYSKQEVIGGLTIWLAILAFFWHVHVENSTRRQEEEKRLAPFQDTLKQFVDIPGLRIPNHRELQRPPDDSTQEARLEWQYEKGRRASLVGTVHEATGLPFAEEDQLPGSAYTRGGIITINRDLKRRGAEDAITDHFLDLPEILQPASPEKVQTAVWIIPRKFETGEYREGELPTGTVWGKGYRWEYVIVVIDLAECLITDIKELSGTRPPNQVRSPGDRYGTRPDAELVKYLAKLPHRKANKH